MADVTYVAGRLPVIDGEPNMVDNPELWDRLYIAGKMSPGICHFPQAPKRATGWDLQVPSGGHGGNTLKKTVPPIEFSVVLELWKGDGAEGEDVDHLGEWENWKPILATAIKPPLYTGSKYAASSMRALAIYHPLLAGLTPPVTDVVVKSVTEPLPDGTGRGFVTIEFIEYRPFLPRPTVPLNGTTTRTGQVAGGTNTDAKAKLDQARQENDAEWQKP